MLGIKIKNLPFHGDLVLFFYVVELNLIFIKNMRY